MVTVAQIANASRGELLCITYELLLEQIQLAEDCEGEERKKHIARSISIIQMLAGDLDFNVPLSKELFNIYVYVQGLLIKYKTKEKIQEAYGLIHKIYEGFKVVADKESDKAPSIQNAEQIYAGLTYGRENITETTMQDYNRGFKA